MVDKTKLTLKRYLTVDFTYAERIPFADRSISEFLKYLDEPGKYIKDERGTWHNKDYILKFRRREISEERHEHTGHPQYDEITQ